MLLWAMTLAACGAGVASLPVCLASLVVEPTRLPDEPARQLAMMQRCMLEGMRVTVWRLPTSPQGVEAISRQYHAEAHSFAFTQEGYLNAVEVAPASGEGPVPAAVVLLHGYSDSLVGLEPLALSLVRQGHRVLMVDMPAHGLSPGTRCTYGRLEVPALHQALLHYVASARLGDRPALALVGSSFGGVMAMKLAMHQQSARQPVPCLGVVAAGPYHHLPTAIHRYAQVMYGITWRPLLRAIASIASRQSGLTPAEENPMATGLHGSFPALVILRGEHDVLLEHDEAAELARTWPGAGRHEDLQSLEHFGLLRRDPAIERVLAILGEWAGTRAG